MPTQIVGATGIDKVQDGIIVNADIDTVAASKLTGALTAISGASLTNLPADSTKLPLAGGTLTGNLAYVNMTTGDSTSTTNKIRMGAGSDLVIHHDGANSYIEDTGTGALRILGSSVQLRNPADSEVMISATADGAVELYHNNTKKFETTSAGFWAPGAILQCVSANVDGNATTTSTTFSATNASITITPISTSSKMLISYHGGRTGFAGSGGGDGAIKIYKSAGGGSYQTLEANDRGVANFYGFGDFYSPTSLQWLDSPNTTDECIYKIYIARRSGSGTFSLSRDGSQGQNMTVMEIGV